MLQLFVKLLSILLLFISYCAGNSLFYSNFVDLHISTGGHGYGVGGNPPGATVPFGFVRLSPDTVEVDDLFIPYDHFGGYYYGDSHIRLFSHTHMIGSGVLDYGTIGVMPLPRIPDSSDVTNYGFRSLFLHDKEIAIPGYYSVILETHKIEVELTATQLVGLHRYTYLSSSYKKVVLFSVSHTLSPKACKDAYVEIHPESNEVIGWNLNMGPLSGRFGGLTTYFVARFRQPIIELGTWNQGAIRNGSRRENGTDIGAFVLIGQGSENENPNIIEFYVGLSLISIDQARRNLMFDILSRNQTFESVENQSRIIWEEALAAIEVSGGQTSDMIKFYTAFYHTLMAPTTFSEAGNYYVGFDKKIHQLNETTEDYRYRFKLPQQRFFSDMSIWDTYRTQFPWLGLVRPRELLDIVRSLVLMYEQGGDLPRWPLAYGYTNGMDGTHADIVIADAYFKGLKDFDVETAYKGMRQGATQSQTHAGRDYIEDWLSLGYIPYEKDPKGATRTQAYSYDDWTIGNLAGSLGLKEDQELFLNRSKNFKKVWNQQHKFFCPKTSQGDWECPPIWTNVFDKRYVEGDAWHYRFAVHDIPGLIELFGSNESFVTALLEFFVRSEDDPYNILPNPYYWAGNEPDILTVYLFSFAGRPDLTQKYVRWNMEHRFSAQPDGIPGNDDYGTMSAWFTFGALGFYPLSGSPVGQYLLGSPLFPQAVIHLPSGDIVCKAYNYSPTHIYVERAYINGHAIDMRSPFIYHSQLVNGALLEFWMSDQPHIP